MEEEEEEEEEDGGVGVGGGGFQICWFALGKVDLVVLEDLTPVQT